MAKGHQALIKLRFETNCNENNIRLMECDLSSFDSVRNFVSLYNNEEDRLDVLICNAGLVYISTIYSKDSLKYVMKVSYLGPFLLTNLLLDKLKQCQPSRIINVSSVAHQYQYGHYHKMCCVIHLRDKTVKSIYLEYHEDTEDPMNENIHNTHDIIGINNIIVIG
ncbi:unnamed protein product [Rotaria magnacalcarata]|uniref:Uncharacterized protein n=1 Tax=Rotaria magnacalcarata TaxID=392030 RepID=A0A820EC76_9BILA|nr:unnamed protein product [Rotaria magnacalcarata]CAF4014465.1 unnamed protein product [Rotaria magnacalcarata]CAF4071307.1 unnamed protein product [Rotaria magnacalcarata]CAF4244075.1 unnamed protein product [Rotaria magnacalcarata]CAF4352227.1 unnamed protein product [Rotaria magnacalcarata]